MRSKWFLRVMLIVITLFALTSIAVAEEDEPSLLDIACEPTDIIQMPDGSFLVTDAYYKVVLHVDGDQTTLYAGTPTR